MTIAAGQTLTLDNDTLNNVGITDNGILAVNTLTLSGATITATSGGATFENNGNSISGGGQIGNGNDDLTLDNAAGTIETAGATLTVHTGNAVTNAGTFLVNGGIFDIVDAITGGGSASIQGGTFELGSTDAQALNFNSTSGGTLALGNAAGFTGAISGLVAGNTIDLLNISPSSIASTSINGSTLTVNLTSGGPLTYQIAGALTGNYFAVQNDAGSGSDLVLSPNVLAISVAATDSALGTQVGQELVATATLNADNAVINYQWQVSSNGGASWTDVSATTTGDYNGGTLSSFLQLSVANQGDLVRAVGSFVDGTGQTITATSAATAAVTDVTPEITPPFNYTVDSLTIVKGGTQVYDDTLSQAPPVSPNANGNPVEFFTQGTVWAEGLNSAGQPAAILSSTGVAPSGSGDGNAIVSALLNTNTQSGSTSGLKEGGTFTVGATFDLPVSAAVLRGEFGLELNDGTPTQGSDQVVSLVLTSVSGVTTVELQQSNLTNSTSSTGEAANTTTNLFTQALTVPQGDNEIVFQLAHVANSTAITGTFELLDNGTLDPSTLTTFTPTGTIFTGGVNWTRADIFAGTTPSVSLSGPVQTPHEGQTLTAGATTNDPDATAIVYQWEESSSAAFTTFNIIATDNVSIGTNSATYTVQGSDVGDYIRVVATTNDSSNPTSETSTVTGQVLPVAPTVTVPVSVTMNEESSAALNVTEAGFSANDALSLTIGGLPADATLTDSHGDMLAISGGTITLTSAELTALTLHAGEVTNTTLTVTGTATNNGLVATSVQHSINLIVSPVAPAISISPASVSVNEDGTIGLPIVVTPADPNDSVTVTIGAIPAGDTLNDGNGDHFAGGGSPVTMSLAQFESGASLTVGPEATNTPIELSIQASNAEGTGANAAIQHLAVTVNPVAPTLTIANHTLSVAEDGTVALGISETPFDGHDTVSVLISGIPSDATLSDSNDHSLTVSGGDITLTPAELAGLTLQAGDTSGTLTVVATNTEGLTASSAAQTIGVNVNAAAQTNTWTGTGDWTDGTHWSAGSPPNQGAAAAIASGHAQVNSDLMLDANTI